MGSICPVQCTMVCIFFFEFFWIYIKASLLSLKVIILCVAALSLIVLPGLCYNPKLRTPVSLIVYHKSGFSFQSGNQKGNKVCSVTAGGWTLTIQIHWILPDLFFFLVLNLHSHFFFVCRQADLKHFMIVWSKLSVKLCLLETRSTQSELKVTNSSSWIMLKTKIQNTNTHFRLYFNGLLTENTVFVFNNEFTAGRSINVFSIWMQFSHL